VAVVPPVAVAVPIVGALGTDDATFVTTMVTVAVELPAPFVPVTVYEPEAEVAVGVPLITPVDELMRRPDGSAGLMVHVSTIPPEFEGVNDVITVEITPFIVEVV
jgi:hypothetical protein